MTTAKAEAHYLARHTHEMEGHKWAVHNPKDLPLTELPIIYGFNNGGSPGWYIAQLIAEDGVALGSHACSHEGYMEHDLGILEGTRPDRHEDFREHYPDGYRMVFVPMSDVKSCEGLMKAYGLNQEKLKAHEAASKGSNAEVEVELSAD